MMRSSSHALLERCSFLLVVLVLAAGSAAGQTFGRVSGVVKDGDGSPIEGVKITVTDPEGSFRKEFTTNRNGRYTVAVADATRTYLYRLEKEGYATVEVMYKVPIGTVERRDFVMTSGEGAAGAAPVHADRRTGRPAVDAFNEGAQAFQSEQYELAVEHFERARGLDPDLDAVHSVLARAYLLVRRYDDALASASRALEIDARDEAALDARYRAYQALGDEAAAAEAMRQLAAVAQPEVLAFNTGVEAMRSQDLELAEARFRKAIELAPALAPAHAALSTLLLKRQRYEEALAAADATLELEPGNVTALGVRYDSLRALGRNEEAQAAKADLAAKAPGVIIQSHLERGLELFNANRIEEARSSLEEVLVLDPNHARAHYALGLCYLNLGDIPRAKHHLQRFIETAPADDPDGATAREMLQSL